MERRLFGTDGVRGKVNHYPMTSELALKLAMVVGRRFINGHQRHVVVMGKDTRRSGYLLETALASGFMAVGIDVAFVGPLPTPAVAMLTKSMRADLGVMISASHNPYFDNGIKFFGPDGYKLSDALEIEIEKDLVQLADTENYLASPDKIGTATRLTDAAGRYIEYVKATFPKGMDLSGLKIVVDCAHGATYHVAPRVLWELGADVITIGHEPNGFNINDHCGATAPQALQQAVRNHQADIGLALDGDGDRLIVVDNRGELIDGDQIMGLIVRDWHEKGLLKGGGIVATVMSNLGLERYLQSLGLTLYRAPVGDRYVVDFMRRHHVNLGGEQSGHIILSDYGTTGDGIIAALQFLATLRASGKSSRELGRVFTPVPQILKNVRLEKGEPAQILAQDKVQKIIGDSEKSLGAHGRLLVRKSGTEPIIRIMVEGDNANEIQTIADDIADVMMRVAV